MNFVIIMTDTQNKSMVGAYGNRMVNTPNLDRLSESSSITVSALPIPENGIWKGRVILVMVFRVEGLSLIGGTMVNHMRRISVHNYFTNTELVRLRMISDKQALRKTPCGDTASPTALSTSCNK